VIGIKIICILINLESGIGNTFAHDVHNTLQTITSCEFGHVLDSHGIIPLDNARFANKEYTPFTINDATYETDVPDASSITFSKVMLETAGAVGFSFLLGFITYQKTDDPGLAWCVGAPVGPEIGATLVGHTVMQPNGSGWKSMLGSITGAAIGGAILYGVSWVIAHSPDISASDKYWYGIAPALSFPVIGAVVGYNAGYSGVYSNSALFNVRNNCASASGGYRNISARIQLISVRF
jgi:hypothetical protein